MTDRPGTDDGVLATPDAESRATLPVTVIIPVYNREGAIAASVKSVLAQAPLAAAEIIVVDDASTDGSAEVARSLGCRVLVQPRNGGSATARNAALDAVRTPWVAFLDSDDEWHPNLLERLWPSTDGRVLVSGGGVLSVGGKPVTNLGTEQEPGLVLDSPAVLYERANPVVTSATLARTEVLRELGGFRSDLRISEDLDLWLRVLERGEGWCDPAPLVTYHRGADAKSESDPERVPRARASIARSFKDRAWWSPDLNAHYVGPVYWEGGRSALRSRNLAAALGLFARAFSQPGRIRGIVEQMRRARAQRSRFKLQTMPNGDAPSDMPLGRLLRLELSLNRRDPRCAFIVLAFRCARSARGSGARARRSSLPVLVLYKLIVEWVLGVDLPLRLQVGPGLRLFHAFGLVVHPDVVLGPGAVLKHGVTIGHRGDEDGFEGPVPIVGANVVFGPNSQALGGIQIGDGARIGAGAVVLTDVPPGAAAVGVPARIIGSPG